MKENAATNPKGIIAVDTDKGAGALVYWRLDGTLNVGRLAHAWERAGLDERLLPTLPGPSTALARSVREVATGRRLVRPLAKRGGHAIVDELASGTDLQHVVGLRVTCDALGRPVFDPPGHYLATTIRTAYDRHLEECASEDVGSWLARRLIPRVDGVALRDTGGFYFVPPTSLETWRSMSDAIRVVSSHVIFEIPAMRSSRAVEAILDAIEQEAAKEAAEMEAELAAGEIGERAFGSRARRVEDVSKKVARYEAILGAKLDALRGRLESLHANLVVASMKVAAADGRNLGAA